MNQVSKTKGSRSERDYAPGELLQVDTIVPINNSYAVIMSDKAAKFTYAKILLKNFQNLLSITDKKVVFLIGFIVISNYFTTKRNERMMWHFCVADLFIWSLLITWTTNRIIQENKM